MITKMKKLILLLLFIPLLSFGQEYDIIKNDKNQIVVKDNYGNKIAVGEKNFYGEFVWKDNDRNTISKFSKDFRSFDIKKDDDNNIISKGKFDYFGDYEVKDDSGNLLYKYKKNNSGEIVTKDSDGNTIGKFKFDKKGSVKYIDLSKSLFERAKKYSVYSPSFESKDELKTIKGDYKNKYSVYTPHFSNTYEGYSISSALSNLSKTLSSISSNIQIKRNYLEGLEYKYLKVLDKVPVDIPNTIVYKFFLKSKELIVKSMKSDREMMIRGILRPATDYEKGLKENYKNFRLLVEMLNKISIYINDVNNLNIDNVEKAQFNYLVNKTFNEIRISFYDSYDKPCKKCQGYSYIHQNLLVDGERKSSFKSLYDLIISSINGDYTKYLEDNKALYLYASTYRTKVLSSRKFFLTTLSSKQREKFYKGEAKFFKKNKTSWWRIQYTGTMESFYNNSSYPVDWMGYNPFEKIKQLRLFEAYLKTQS